jgi:uncharacterized membrane protein YeiH
VTAGKEDVAQYGIIIGVVCTFGGGTLTEMAFGIWPELVIS